MRYSLTYPIVIFLSIMVYTYGMQLSSPSQGQVVLSVLVIRTRTGKPFANTNVYLVRDQAYPYVTHGSPPDLEAKTGADGRAVFRLEQPVPEKLSFAIPGGGRLCSRYQYPTAELFNRGEVGQLNGCEVGKNVNVNLTAKPGELILFVNPYTRWEVFKREFGIK